MSSTEEQIAETGRRAVRTHLIEPLQAEGMKRRKGETLEDEQAYIERLVRRLSYMRAEALDELLPIVRGLAGGGGRNRWPDEISVLNFAHAIQPPPDVSDDILTSWLRSVEGPIVRREGTLAATRMFIKRFRRPPKDKAGSRFYAGQVREMQREIDRDIEAARRAMANGEARQSEIDMVRGYDRMIAGLEALVDEGIARRNEKAAGEGEAA